MEAIYDVSPLLWGALIFLALFVSCFLAWKAIEWLRYRKKFDGGAAEAGRMKEREQKELGAVDPNNLHPELRPRPGAQSHEGRSESA